MDLRAGVYDGSSYEQLRLWGDDVLLRVVDAGDVQVVEFRSEDRDGPPAHVHPLDEIEYVIEGEVEFLVDGTWTRGGPGTVQLLPAGAAHSVRVPAGAARVLMVTVGAPYDGFARDSAALAGAGEGYPDPAALLDVATRHGLRLA
ncbi:MAG TPA: cupin domain-containing protein [Acidimicrobiales bacterium]|nr:cupin domain-containing protein [Acidimicrobiales bacterium]